MKAMILAAGFGTRLRPYSLLRPKPLFPVLDQPLILQTISALREAGCVEIIVNCHHLHEQICRLLSPLPFVRLSVEESELGAGGGVRKALPLLGNEPFLLVNGDIFHTVDYKKNYNDHLASGADASLVLHDYPRFNKVRLADDGYIVGFEPGPSAPRPPLAFTGIQVVNPQLAEMIPGHGFYNMIDCYRQAIRTGGKVRGVVATGHFWTDMGTPADYLALHGHLLAEAARGGGSSFFIGEDVRCAQADFHDWVSIGRGARIGEGACLRRVVVWDGAVVEPGQRLEDTIVT